MKRIYLILFLIPVLFLFSSCDSDSLILPADSLLSPPLYYEEYEELVESFNQNIKGETTLLTPKKGSFRSAIIVEDLDSDGYREAIIFYKNNSDMSIARMHYFDLIGNRWVSFGDFNGYGSGIESVELIDMDLDGKSELIVMWNTSGSASGNILSVYRLDYVTKCFKEISNESCFLSEIVDIDGNGRKDIFLIGQNNAQNVSQKVAKAMRLSGDSVIIFGETALDSNISNYSSVKTEKSSKESPMRIYIDALKGEHQMITEVVYWNKEKSELCAPLLDSETLTNSTTLRHDPIVCYDINNDGIIEIPVQMSVIGKSDENIPSESENVYLTEWKSLGSSGLETVAYSFVNFQDGYMINLDKLETDSLGIRNYRSQNCWIIYSADNNKKPVNELYSVFKIPHIKWNTENYDNYIPVIENEDSVVCVFITSDGKRLGLDENFVKSKIVKLP